MLLFAFLTLLAGLLLGLADLFLRLVQFFLPPLFLLLAAVLVAARTQQDQSGGQVSAAPRAKWICLLRI